MASVERFWTRRLRWRWRGAWQWPAFAVALVVDALLLDRLPPTRVDLDLVGGLIVASFGNLVLLGAVAPWLGRRLHERRAALLAGTEPGSTTPVEVVSDRVATVLLLAGMVGLLAAGLATRPTIVAADRQVERNARAVRDYVLAHGDEEMRRNLETANYVRLGDGYFRTCIADDDRRRATCLFVDVTREPPALRRDPSTLPNREFLPHGGG